MNQITFRYSCSSDSHLIEKANGIEYLYTSVDKHPDVRSMVTKFIQFMHTLNGNPTHVGIVMPKIGAQYTYTV